jgi:hypothetical protein
MTANKQYDVFETSVKGKLPLLQLQIIWEVLRSDLDFLLYNYLYFPITESEVLKPDWLSRVRENSWHSCPQRVRHTWPHPVIWGWSTWPSYRVSHSLFIGLPTEYFIRGWSTWPSYRVSHSLFIHFISLFPEVFIWGWSTWPSSRVSLSVFIGLLTE